MHFLPTHRINARKSSASGLLSAAIATLLFTPFTVAAQAECAISDTAWGSGDRYVARGNWATFTSGEPDAYDIFAGQTLPAGSAEVKHENGDVTIEISLMNGFVFSESNGEENLHVESYVDGSPPPRNPRPGRFTYKSSEAGVSASIQVPEAEYYGIHLVVDDISQCPTELVCADFASLGAGTSVEGANTVLEGLTISTPKNGAIALVEGGTFDESTYGAPNALCSADDSIRNGGMDPIGGGFADVIAKRNLVAHEYEFEFDSIVKGFYLRMLDNADFNISQLKDFKSSMTALNAALKEVDEQSLEFTVGADLNPRTGSTLDGDPDLCKAGDAVDAKPGQPGNFLWSVTGDGINSVKLKMNDGGTAWDPNIAFDTLCYDKYIVE